jgi:hypothetical protein
MTEKPAPCPWCGSAACITVKGPIGRHHVWVMCDMCGACGPSEDATGGTAHGLAAGDRAVAAWNRVAQSAAAVVAAALSALAVPTGSGF